MIKNYLVLISILVSQFAFSQELISDSTEPSLALYDSQTPTSTEISSQYFGQLNFPQPLYYWSSTENSNSHFYLSGYIYPADTKEDIADALYTPLKSQSLLEPLGTDKASRADVFDGYCAILGNDLYFQNGWLVLGPGTHDLSFYTYYTKDGSTGKLTAKSSSFNNKTSSIATYKMLGNGCNPQQDIPTLKSANNSLFPLNATNKYYQLINTNTGMIRLPLETTIYIASQHNSYYKLSNDKHFFYISGGFSEKAEYLNVPKCYSVTLDYWDDNLNWDSNKTFGEGEYYLPSFKISKLLGARTQYNSNCTPKPRAAKISLQRSPSYCIQPDSGRYSVFENTQLVLNSACNFNDKYQFFLDKTMVLRHKDSNLCVSAPQGAAPAINSPVVLRKTCTSSNDGIKLTSSGELEHISTGLCIVPQASINESYTPNGISPLVFKSCNGVKYVSALNGTEDYPLDFNGQNLTRYEGKLVSSSYDDLPTFSADFYLRMNGDVANAFGRENFKAAKEHWLAHGKQEGRPSSPAFIVKEYLQLNADLKAAYGNDYTSAINHFITYGINEGRQSTYAFNVRDYLNLYSDLRAAFGASNFMAAEKHWINYGVNEGRQSSNTFNIRAYINNYTDLKATFAPDDFMGGLIHYSQFGYAEGRTNTN